MSSSLDSELWDECLKLISFCPVCDARYNSIKARVLAEQEETRLLHVQCRKCKHSILALVLINQVGASSVGLLTDLSYEDVLRIGSNQSVSLDEVIEAHRLFSTDSWIKKLGRASWEQFPQVRERVARRERKEQKNNATR